ncbi:S-adenosylmethionine decarboxylase family protein [Mucilaginibacter sp. OK283]|jgi:S-adenosylmethionine decarboxylase|uniref:S-adenosylmethionine decarboxylase family protein n=1 Tax=Mucilaginibacter sp. OK283 TaxID=1881049 RepID=UPI0008AF743A|nr:S-adenosylmethionine decarboxylase [Mucilaginibacter sp. OK283]SEO42072.1 S-adenosylmethionine decarboxylase [Mucilaginibacter sp. OK283]
MPYKPGLHLLSEFSTDKPNLLQSSAACRQLFNQLIDTYQLTKVGEVYHDFDGGGFTAVVCLTESHMSIHTWPEYGMATFDVFLSNYQKENDDKARAIYQGVIAFFEGTEMQKNEVKR